MLLLLPLGSIAQDGHIQADVVLQLPGVNDEGHPYIFFQSEFPYKTTGEIRIICRQLKKQDSLVVYDLLFKNVSFDERASSQNLYFNKAETKHVSPVQISFLRALERLNAMPAGIYTTSLFVTTKDSISISKCFLNEVDSNLTIKGKLKDRLDAIVSNTSQQNTSNLLSTRNSRQNSLSNNELDRTSKRMSRKLGRSSGIDMRPVIEDTKSYMELYSENWFLGRYELLDTRSMQLKITGEAMALKENATSLVTTNLKDFQSVSNQLKELYQKSQKKKEGIAGSLEVSEFMSNGQEPGSTQENNYTELRGDINTKVFDMPINIEGYYTTQDRHREAKASYIRLHYDLEEAKSTLLKQINGYKSKFGEAVAQGKGLEQVYNSYLSSLTNEKNTLLHELSSRYGINEISLQQYDGDIDKILNAQGAIDTTKLLSKAIALAEKQINKDSIIESPKANKLEKAKEEIKKDKEKIKKQYERLVKLKQVYERYKTLLHQYQEQLHMDSALVYNKLEALSKNKDASYKDMLKAANGLLPEGKVKQFSSGLTNLDAGIINQYASSYTMAGQNLKGLSAGYDLGIIHAGVTIGKTEYTSREGNVDKYNTYLGKVGFKPAKGHNVDLIYYGYSPAIKSLQNDNFYQHTDIAPGGYKEPVTIFSLNYDGQVGKSLLIHSEGAASFKKGENTQLSMDNSATKASIDYIVPKTPVNIKAEWEHLGNSFENNALPYTKAGTERYTLAGTADLFRSFMTLGIQYNYLQQKSFSSIGRNTKWGFDIKTHSKRYPSVQLSYKPFSTFRAYNDTLNISQRPITGEVWTGRASYQLKHLKVIHRFTLVYNRNRSNMDTINYTSEILQTGYIYTHGNNAYNINAGWMSMPATVNEDGKYINIASWFISTALSKTLNKQISGSISEDIALAKYGLQRTATTLGVNYNMGKLPVTLRLQARYTNYKIAEETERKSLYAAMIGMTWRFKTGPRQ